MGVGKNRIMRLRTIINTKKTLLVHCLIFSMIVHCCAWFLAPQYQPGLRLNKLFTAKVVTVQDHFVEIKQPGLTESSVKVSEVELAKPVERKVKQRKVKKVRRKIKRQRKKRIVKVQPKPSPTPKPTAVSIEKTKTELDTLDQALS